MARLPVRATDAGAMEQPGISVLVCAHGSSSPLTLYQDPVSAGTLTQPVVTGRDGGVPGWIVVPVNVDILDAASGAVLATSFLGSPLDPDVEAETERAEAAETLLAPLDSAALTGEPTAPTAATDDDSTAIATTAYVLGQASDDDPLADDDTAGAGIASRWARGDHVHPAVTTPIAVPAHYGVLMSADAVLSGTSVNASTGALTYTLAAADPLWLVNSGGLLVPVTLAAVSGGTLTPAALPATAEYRGYGIEIDETGALSFSTGGTDQTTAALALTNINTVPANGKMRLHDIVLLNTAGTITLSTTRGRRAWANGAKGSITAAGQTISSASVTTISGLTPIRLETVAAASRIIKGTFLVAVTATVGNNETTKLSPVVDGVDFAGGAPGAWISAASYYNSNLPMVVQFVAECATLAAGSHLFTLFAARTTANLTMTVTAWFEEVLPNVSNGTA